MASSTNIIDTATASKLIEEKPDVLNKIAKMGYITKVGRDKWNLIDVVQGHARWIKDHGPSKKVPGRPSQYNAKTYPKHAEKLCALGATDPELAEFFDVSPSTIDKWKARYPAFLQALKTGKANSDERVERSLYQRAMGYSHPEDKIFFPAGAAEPVVVPTIKHYPPDTTAAIFWLKNRRPEVWRDKVETQVNATVQHVTPEAASKEDDDLFISFAQKAKQIEPPQSESVR